MDWLYTETRRHERRLRERAEWQEARIEALKIVALALGICWVFKLAGWIP